MRDYKRGDVLGKIMQLAGLIRDAQTIAGDPEVDDAILIEARVYIMMLNDELVDEIAGKAKEKAS